MWRDASEASGWRTATACTTVMQHGICIGGYGDTTWNTDHGCCCFDAHVSASVCYHACTVMCCACCSSSCVAWRGMCHRVLAVCVSLCAGVTSIRVACACACARVLCVSLCACVASLCVVCVCGCVMICREGGDTCTLSTRQMEAWTCDDSLHQHMDTRHDHAG